MPRIQPFYLTVLAVSVLLACLVCFPSILCADIYSNDVDKNGEIHFSNLSRGGKYQYCSSTPVHPHKIVIYRSKWNKEEAKWFKIAAEQGDANAQLIMGVMYDQGEGVPQDDKEAVKWYKLAAEQGGAEAQYNLGMMYDQGEGAPQDDNEAFKWYKLSAEQGHASAQYNLGVMHYEGEGVPQDDKEAVKWYKLAAEQGHASAQNNLGVMYKKGKGVPEDYVEAYKWYNIAASQGEENAQKNRDILREIMTPDQIAEGQRLSREFHAKKYEPEVKKEEIRLLPPEDVDRIHKSAQRKTARTRVIYSDDRYTLIPHEEEKQDHKKPEFSITLPLGWIEIPKSEVFIFEKNIESIVPEIPAEYSDYAFQLQASENWFEYPYIVVSVKNTGRIPDGQLEGLEGYSLQETIDKKFKKAFSPIMSDMQAGKAVYDKQNKIIWMRFEMNAAYIGPISCISGMMLTEKGFIQASCYSLQADYPNYETAFKSVVTSVIPEPRLVYKSKWTDNLPDFITGLDWGKITAKALAGVMAGGFIYGIMALIAAFKKKKDEFAKKTAATTNNINYPKMLSDPELTTGPSDKGGKFLGGNHHPWRRFFARGIDLSIFGLIPFVALCWAVVYYFPNKAMGFAEAIQNPFIVTILLVGLWIPIEANLLSVLGNTPGKWLFGISVRSTSGSSLSFSQALERSFRVAIQGLGLGIPVLSLFTQLFAYRRLTKTGTSLWDSATECVVTHKIWGVGRAVACAGSVIFVYVIMTLIMTLLNEAVKYK